MADTDHRRDLPILMDSASNQARTIAQGLIGAQQLVQSQLLAIDERNPSLNAFVQRVPDELALADAQRIHSEATTAPSPLAGTTFAVKDNLDIAGMPSHCGLRALHAGPAKTDAMVVERLRGAGLILTGKANMAPMAVGVSNHNTDFGDCFNPLRTGYSPGGSSGGAASAVAAGLAGIALGTDTMGSVRLPAAFCGVIGFKPTWGTFPVRGLMPLCRSLDSIGVIARSIEDVQQACEILWGPDAIVLTDVPARSPVLAVPRRTELLSLDPDVFAAFEAAKRSLVLAGHPLVEVDIDAFPFSRVRRAGLLLCEAELIDSLAATYEERRDELPADLCAMLDYISAKHAVDLARAHTLLLEWREWLALRLRGLDAFLLPTSAHVAFAMDTVPPADTADLTAIANVLGLPAISIPLPCPAQNMPAGLQLLGRRFYDRSLLNLAAQIGEAVG